MKTLFKLALATVMSCALLLAPKAKAQIPTVGVQAMYGPIVIALSTATNVASVIDVGKQSSVAVQLTCTGDGASTDNMHYYFAYSVDGTTFDANSKIVTVALSGTTTKTIVTNLPSFGCQYIKLSLATNSSGVGVTNTAKYLVKISAP